MVKSAGEEDPSGKAQDRGDTEDQSAGESQRGTEVQAAAGESRVRLRAEADFFRGKDEVRFYYLDGEQWKGLGSAKKLYFRLDHFTGCRFGLFLYATQEKGGRAGFMDFVYKDGEGDEEGKE